MILEYSEFHNKTKFDVISLIKSDIPDCISDIWDMSMDLRDLDFDPTFIIEYGHLGFSIEMVNGEMELSENQYTADFENPSARYSQIKSAIKSGPFKMWIYFDWAKIRKTRPEDREEITKAVDDFKYRVEMAFPFIDCTSEISRNFHIKIDRGNLI